MWRGENLQFEKEGGAAIGRSAQKHRMFANRVIGGFKVPCVALYIVVVLVIIVYGFFLRKTGLRDPLAKRLFHHPVCQDIDGWSISHLVFFGLLGFLFPGHYLQFLLVGIGWEVIETALGQNKFEVSGKRLQLIGEQDGAGASTGKDDAYWYGKESDVVVDILGYIIGSLLADKYWPNTPKKVGARRADPATPAAQHEPKSFVRAPPPSWV